MTGRHMQLHAEAMPTSAERRTIIAEYLAHLRRANATDATIHSRSELLHRIDRELPYGVTGASDTELKAWLYRDGWAQNTKATYYVGLQSFYRWATDPSDPRITLNPMEDLEQLKHREGFARPVTDEQLRTIFREAVEPYLTYSKLAAYQGLRCIEISRLDREHVTREKLFVVKGKGGRPRMHDTDGYVWDALKDLPPGAIARGKDGLRADALQVSGNTAHYFQRQLGMPGVTLHRLRHWLGVTTQRIYRDIRVTQAVLGHRSLSSTQIYTEATLDQQREARSMLPRLAG